MSAAAESGGAARVRERIDEAWRRLRAAADGLAPEVRVRPTSAGWTPAEMLAHVAFWEEAAPYVIEHMLRGKPDPSSWPFPSGYDPFAVEEDWPADTVHNAREAAWAREQSWETILQRVDAAHGRLLEVLATVSDAEAIEYAGYLGELRTHLEEHLPEIDEA